jgi:S1-C subfamily serine protease/serine/threonine protein kinase
MDTLNPGTHIGRYHIVQLIGQGGFGAVYEAMDDRLGRRVALKQLLRGGDRISRQFEHEARLLANLSHPALPRVTDHFSDAGDAKDASAARRQFLVMDYISGDDLMTMLMQRDAPFPVDQVLQWGVLLLDALQYLHTRQILHRDIKPQNLKLQADGTIMLLDFGLAKGSAGDAPPPTTESSFLAYTKGYAPPEQVDTDERRGAHERMGTDERSDIYSLAGTLHCLLTNTGPVDAQTRMLAAARGRPDPLRSAHELNPDVPEAVSRVLMQALALEPNQRPPSAEAMRMMLEAARGGVIAPPPRRPAAAPTVRVAATKIEESAMLTSLLGLPSTPAPQRTAAPSRPAPQSYVTRPMSVEAPLSHTSQAPRPRIRRRVWQLTGIGAAGLLVVALAVAAAPVLSKIGSIHIGPTATSQAVTTAGPTATPAPLTPAQIADKLGPSTVMINADFPPTALSDSEIGAGSGIVINQEGDILTNAHVVEGASALSIALSGSDTTRPARVIGRSTCDDLAVLRVENTAGLLPATLGNSSDLQLGDSIVALGYPMSFDINNQLALTRGSVSRLNVTSGHYASLIQIDAALNPGNSGGPLANERGEVVGINSLGYNGADASNVGFAISIDYARTKLADLRGGHSRGWLGMNLEPNRYEKFFGTKAGLVVAAVDSRSPASAIDIQPADLLITFGGSDVNSNDDVCKILQSHGDGEALDVRLLRVTKTKVQILGGSIMIGKYSPGEPQLRILKEAPLGKQAPSDTANDGATAAYTDDFSKDTGSWRTGHADWIDAQVSDGAYQVTLHSANSYFLSPAAAVAPGRNMGIAADILVQGNARAGVALRYHEQGDTKSFYTCWIDSAQSYGCFVTVADQLTTLAEPTFSEAIKPGQVNRVILIAEGNVVSLLINDQEVAKFSDGALASGIPALYLENFDTEAGASFDNVKVVRASR